MNNKLLNTTSIMKYFLLGCGTITALIVIVIGICMINSGSNKMEITTYHPFRSVKAKEQYLKVYDLKAKKWPIASESRIVKTSYGDTFVRISGSTGAPPLVLLHGINGNSLQWIPNIEGFSAKFRVYAVDNIYDYGRSVYSRDIKTPDDYVNWLNELFDALGLGSRINLVGLSYGGWLTTQYALRFPDRLDKIVLLAPVCTVLPLSYKWIGRAVLCAVPHRYFTKSFLFWLLADLAKNEAGRNVIEEHVDESYLALRSFKAKRMVNPTVLSDKELQAIKIPTLFVVGENEKLYSAHKAIKRLNEVVPRIKTEIIPKAGHDLTIVQTKLVNEKVLEFLK